MPVAAPRAAEARCPGERENVVKPCRRSPLELYTPGETAVRNGTHAPMLCSASVLRQWPQLLVSHESRFPLNPSPGPPPRRRTP